MSEIKLASIINIEELNNLFEQYLNLYQIKSLGENSKQFLTQRLKNKDSIIYIVFENQIAAGFVQLYPSFSSMAMKPIWVLNDLFISPNYRRNGLAKKLIAEVENQAKKNKIFSIKLATAINNLEANQLYLSLDYLINDQFTFYSKRIFVTR